MADALHDRYLRLLGCAPRPPGLDALAELVRAHVERVPFENVSKLWRLRRHGLAGPPELAEYLDGIEHLRLGGTCYANAAHLNGLLRALGYRAKLCGAEMSAPDVHAVNVVELDGREHLVDVGYGAPLRSPLPLDAAGDLVVADGRDRYVLRPRDATGRSALEHHRDGALRHGYRVQPIARDLSHFRGVIAESFLPAAWFMNRVVFARFSPGRSLTLRNLALTDVRGTEVRRRALRDRSELPAAIEEAFGVPPEVTAEAIEGVTDLAPDPQA